mgnify:CR=1 FL=1
MADYLIEFNNNNKVKSENDIQDVDILNAMRKRREVLPQMWDVFERINQEEKQVDPKAGKGKQQNTRTVLKGKFSVIHRRYIVAKGAFPCSLCGRCFLFNQGRPREGIPYADADIVQGDQDSNTDSPSDGLYPCPQCGKLFPRRTSLKRHQQIHFEGKKFVCKVCGKAFNRNEHLTRHMLSHTGGRPFQCDLCSKVFTRKEHLVRHRQCHDVSGVVIKEEPDDSVNSYGFSDFADATETKPFVCDICHSAYARREHMTKHKKVAHGIDADPESEPKPYCCNHCFKTFTRKEHLTRHKKIHIREAFSGNYEIADGVAPSLLISGPTGSKLQKDKSKKDVLIPLTVNCNISKLNNVTITPQPKGTTILKNPITKPQVSVVKPMTNVTPLSINKDTVTLEISGGSDGGEYKSKVGETLMNSILKNGKYGEISIVDVKNDKKSDVSVSIKKTREVYPDSLMECSIEEGGDSGNDYETSYYDNKMLTEEEKAQLEGFLAETSFGGGDFLASSYDSEGTGKRKRDQTDEYLEEKDSIDLDDLKKMPKCRICSKAFSKKNHLNRHLKRYHNLTKEQVNSGKYEIYENGSGDFDEVEGDEFYDEDGNPILKRPKGTFPCTICKKTFTRKYHMYRHRKTQHGINFPSKQQQRDEPWLKCQNCSLIFNNEEDFQKHECGHADDEEEDEEKKSVVEPKRKPKNSFKCAICKNTFENHDGFKDHVCKKGYKNYLRPKLRDPFDRPFLQVEDLPEPNVCLFQWERPGLTKACRQLFE